MDRKIMTEEMARAAARWWRDKIDGGARHDNGDDSLTSRMACLMADCLNEPTDADHLDLFERELVRMLLKEDEGWGGLTLVSDYGPDELLLSAANAAGISPRNFPYKTWMLLQVQDGEIVVRDGYREPSRVIWRESELPDHKEQEG